MQVTVANIYKCDFCGKRQFRQCDMTRHEKWCKKNPNNFHICFQFCNHLIKTDGEYEGEDYVGTKTIFTCGVTKQEMFSYLAEKRNLPVTKEENTIRMPLECDKYTTEADNLPNDFFDY